MNMTKASRSWDESCAQAPPAAGLDSRRIGDLAAEPLGSGHSCPGPAAGARVARHRPIEPSRHQPLEVVDGGSQVAFVAC
jgi:hypothetical protein